MLTENLDRFPVLWLDGVSTCNSHMIWLIRKINRYYAVSVILDCQHMINTWLNRKAKLHFIFQWKTQN